MMATGNIAVTTSGWHEYTIPGVTKPDPLADLPDSVTAPDTYPARTDAVFFMADADSTNRLNLRAGPGLEYDILGKISSSTLRVYGYSSAAPGWAQLYALLRYFFINSLNAHRRIFARL